MAKYKNLNENIIDNFLEKVFKKAFDQNKSAAMKKLRKQDPELAKDLDTVDSLLQKNRKRLNKMSKSEREKELKRTSDIVRNFQSKLNTNK